MRRSAGGEGAVVDADVFALVVAFAGALGFVGLIGGLWLVVVPPRSARSRVEMTTRRTWRR